MIEAVKNAHADVKDVVDAAEEALRLLSVHWHGASDEEDVEDSEYDDDDSDACGEEEYDDTEEGDTDEE